MTSQNPGSFGVGSGQGERRIGFEEVIPMEQVTEDVNRMTEGELEKLVSGLNEERRNQLREILNEGLTTEDGA